MKSHSLLTVTVLSCSAAAVVSTAAQAGPPPMFPPALVRAHAGPIGPNPAMLTAGPWAVGGPPAMLARGIGPMAPPMLARVGIQRFGGPAMFARGIGPMQAIPAIARIGFNGPGAMGGSPGFSGPPPFAQGPGANILAAGLGPFARPGMLPPGAMPTGPMGGPNPNSGLMHAAFGPGWGGIPPFMMTRVAAQGYGPMSGPPWMIPPGAGGPEAMGPMGRPNPNIGLMHAAFGPGAGGIPPFMMTRVAAQGYGPMSGPPWTPGAGGPGMAGPVPPFVIAYLGGWGGPTGAMAGGPAGPWTGGSQASMGNPYVQWAAAQSFRGMGPGPIGYASYRGPAGIPGMPGMMAGGPRGMGAPPMMGAPGMQWAKFRPMGSPMMFGRGIAPMGPGLGAMGGPGAPSNPAILASMGRMGHSGMIPGRAPIFPAALRGGIGPFGPMGPAMAGPRPTPAAWGASPAALRRGPFPIG